MRNFQALFLLMLLGTLCVDTEGRKCGRRKLRRCENQLRILNEEVSSLGSNEAYPCEIASNVEECFINYAQECFNTDEEVAEFISQNIDELQSQLLDRCDDPDVDLSACVEHLKEDAGQCVETIVAQLMTMFQNNVLDSSTMTENQIKCLVFEMVLDCITVKAEERCGQESSQLFRTGLEEEASAILEACKNNEDVEFHFLSLLQESK